MIEVGLFTWVLLALVLGFFFFMYLMIRRSILGFKEGMEGGREK